MKGRLQRVAYRFRFPGEKGAREQRDSRAWAYMYRRHMRVRVEETAIVRNVLASTSVVCAHIASVCTHVLITGLIASQ